MFEHFTDSARRVLVLAQEETRRLHDISIEPEHLLLGMVREGDGIAAVALSDTGADYHRVAGLIKEDGGQVRRRSGSLPLSNAVMEILERSMGLSWSHADGVVDTEHLLVALLQQVDERIETLLAELDITPQEVVRRVNALRTERSIGETSQP